MKWYLFSIGLFSFIIYRSTKSEINVRETSKGAYNMDQKAVDEKTAFKQGNNVRMHGSEMNSSVIVTGLYNTSNNRKVDISRKWPGDDHIAFLINDNRSSKKDFVNGGWVNRDHLYGAFFQTKSLVK